MNKYVKSVKLLYIIPDGFQSEYVSRKSNYLRQICRNILIDFVKNYVQIDNIKVHFHFIHQFASMG